MFSEETSYGHAVFALLISKVEKRRDVESRNQKAESREDRDGTRRDVLRRDFLQPCCLCSPHHRISFCWSRLRSDKTGSFNWLDCISGKHVLYVFLNTFYLLFTRDSFHTRRISEGPCLPGSFMGADLGEYSGVCLMAERVLGPRLKCLECS